MNKPFIKLFHTPNRAYVFDVNNDELVQISEESFCYLSDILSDDNEPEALIPQELAELMERGYLESESRVKQIRHPHTDNLELFLDRKLTRVALQLTQQCNFRCKYCIYDERTSVKQRGHSSKRMSWETAKKAIDFLWAHSVDSRRVNVAFYGGEPLLEFPLIKKAVEYSESIFRGKQLSFSITTNATLLNEEMIRYFDEHIIPPMISLDGPKDINDQNRVFADGTGTYDTVMQRIDHIREIAPNLAKILLVSMVIDPENDFDCINDILLDEGELKTFGLMPSLVDREYDEEVVQTPESYIQKAQYQYFLSVLSHYGRFSKTMVSPIAAQTLNMALYDSNRIENGISLFQTDCPSGPCISGQSRLFVDVNGRLFPCERVSETSAAMCIGTLDEGFNIQRIIDQLNIGQLTETECRSCWCFRYCTICARHVSDASGNISAKRKLSFCETIRRNAHGKIMQHLFFKETPKLYQTQTRDVLKREVVFK